MLTIRTKDHRPHHGKAELIEVILQPCFEMPSRVDTITVLQGFKAV